MLMVYTGPIAVALFTDGQEYRLLRNEVPWKYLGFALGGTCVVTGLIALVERKVSLRAAAFGVFCGAVIIAAYDLPFDDLLLPPNGDY